MAELCVDPQGFLLLRDGAFTQYPCGCGGSPGPASCCDPVTRPWQRCGPIFRPGPGPNLQHLRIRILLSGSLHYEQQGIGLDGSWDASIDGVGVDEEILFRANPSTCRFQGVWQREVPRIGNLGTPLTTIRFGCDITFIDRGGVYLENSPFFHFYGGASPVLMPAIRFDISHEASHIISAWSWLDAAGGIGAVAHIGVLGEPSRPPLISGAIAPMEATRGRGGCASAWRFGAATNYEAFYLGGGRAFMSGSTGVTVELLDIGPCGGESPGGGLPPGIDPTTLRPDNECEGCG